MTAIFFRKPVASDLKELELLSIQQLKKIKKLLWDIFLDIILFGKNLFLNQKNGKTSCNENEFKSTKLWRYMECP